MNLKSFGKNIFYTIAAQIISILVNFILNIIVPKHISEYQYAYWQTFVLYLTYVGVLHFGLLDGLVLRYSQYDYDELDEKAFRAQFVALLIITSICAVAVLLFSSGMDDAIGRQVVLMVSVGIITKNIFTYHAYAFQLTNRIKQYAVLTIAQRILYGVLVVILLCLKIDNWICFCVADLLGDTVGIVCCFTVNRKICLGSRLPFKESLNETITSIRAGSKLMIANWSSMFLVGGAKMIVQWNWSELIFGKVSFAFSLTTLFLTFISSVSIVLFPGLKRMRTEELPFLYGKIRRILSPLLVTIMLLYYPVVLILSKWLPRYSESFVYLGILLPSIVYTSKVNLLTSNYMKVYRMEKSMLTINFTTIVLALAAYLLCAYFLHNLTVLLVCVVVMIMVRSIVSEIIITRKHRESIKTEIIVEIGMTVAFMYCATVPNTVFGMKLYSGFVFAYFIIMFILTFINKKHDESRR